MKIDIWLREFRKYLDGMFFLRRKNLTNLVDYFNGELLEVGVGYGPDVDFFKSLNSVNKYTGSDRVEFCSIYSEKKTTQNRDIHYYKGDIMPFKNNSFDTVVSIDCLEHIRFKDMDNFFGEIRRVLRKNGKFVLLTPFVYPEHRQPFDYYRYTRFGMEDLANNFGFTPIYIKARSSTLETILVLLNNRLFFGLFPRLISLKFDKEEIYHFSGGEILRWFVFPFTGFIYILLLFLLLIVSLLTKNRDNSPLSLGYSYVFKKKT